MTALPSQIFIGDYLRVLGRLRPGDDATRQIIAGMLGLEYLEPAPPKLQEPIIEIVVPLTARPQPGSAAQAPAASVPDPARKVPFESGAPVKSRLTRRPAASRPQMTPELLESARRFPAVAAADSAAATPDPLFHPRWARGIVSAALSTESPDGPIDIDRLIENLSKREPLVRMPRLSAPTMRRGLQMLVDLGVGMLPYAQDVAGFQQQIRLIAGDDRAQILRFVGSPLRGAGPGPKKTWRDYEPPAEGTPVLALTDLGINTPANLTIAGEWDEFAQLLRRRDCPLVVFTPCSPARWPAEPARMLHIVQWDRATTVSAVRRIIGPFLAAQRQKKQ